MSRAVRRQQAAAPKEGAKRPSLGVRQPKPSARGGGGAPPRPRRRLGIPSWFEEIISELKKVTWPTREETIYLTTVVIIVAVVVGAMLGVIDIFFNWFIDRLLLQ